MNPTRENLTKMLEPAIEAMGYELTDLELNLGHGRGVLRLFIDCEEGIGLDDCEAVSHQVSGLLNVEEPIAVDYRLEVSSPWTGSETGQAGTFRSFCRSPDKDATEAFG